ncbi:MAG: hypothetical protein Q9168_005659 [Polycauliona sp. 1 TL-2023]
MGRSNNNADRSSETVFNLNPSRFDSPVFTIYAGPSRRKFIAHAAFLRESPVLAKIIDGNWKDSEDRTIDLVEWDELTIDQFIHFVYFEEFQVSPPIIGKSDLDGVPDVALTDGIARCTLSDPETAIPVNISLNMDAALLAHQTAGSNNPIHKPSGTNINSNERKMTDIRLASTLLQYSKLYALAQYLEMADLKLQAWQDIRDTLDLLLEAFPRGLDYIIQLIRHIYATTDSLNSSDEPLRSVVARFVASGFPAFQGEDAEKLMEEGGDFVVDVMRKVQERAIEEDHKRDVVVEDLRGEVEKYKKRLRKRGGRLSETKIGTTDLLSDHIDPPHW